MQRIHAQGALFTYFRVRFSKEAVPIDKRVGLPPWPSPHSKYSKHLVNHPPPPRLVFVTQREPCTTPEPSLYLAYALCISISYISPKSNDPPATPGRQVYPSCWGRAERWRSRHRMPDLLDSQMHANEGEGNWGAGRIKGFPLILIKRLSNTVGAPAC